MATNNETQKPSTSNIGFTLFAWLWVGIPLVWGISQTLIKAAALFQ